jgi:hypothetical protein
VDAAFGNIANMDFGVRHRGSAGHERCIADQRGMKDVDVEVEYIELIGLSANLVEHGHVIGQVIPHHRIETQGHVTATNKPGRRFRVAASKKRDVMPLADEFLGMNAFLPAQM